MTFAGYVLFCANNRDFRAIGNDHCYGLGDITGPAGIYTGIGNIAPTEIHTATGTNAAAGIKSSVFLTLYFVFPSIWLIFRFKKN